MEKKKLETKEFKIINDSGELIGSLDAISIVENPAIELKYQLFNQITQKQNFEVNKEKQEITGPAMRANFPILRQDKETNEYYNGIFTPEQIEACRNYFMQNGSTKQANFEHKDNFNNKFFITESWIVKDPKNDKATALNFNDVSEGDWYITYKVTDTDTWNAIKNGDYKGFSVEANLGVFDAINEKEMKETIQSIIYDKVLSETEKEIKVKELLQIK